jgi:predicted CopG family antitoxin
MTTIEIKEDVKAKLLEHRTKKGESYNDILREILDMNEPKKFEPHFYVGTIEINGFNHMGMEDIQDLIINHPDYDGAVYDSFVIKGIKASMEVSQPVIIKVRAKTQKEVEDKMSTIINGIDPEFVDCTCKGLIQVDKTGKRLDDKKVTMDAY